MKKNQKARIEQAEDRALESMDYILETIPTPDFVEIVGRIGGDIKNRVKIKAAQLIVQIMPVRLNQLCSRGLRFASAIQDINMIAPLRKIQRRLTADKACTAGNQNRPHFQQVLPLKI